MTPRVKICGLTRAEDARLAAELGAWALGFVFFPASPRAVTGESVAAIVATVRAAGHRALATGVFVDAPPAEIAAVARTAGLDAVQLHGDEPPAACARLRDLLPNTLIIKAFRPRSVADVGAFEGYAEVCDARLVDAYDPRLAGGTGRRADWALALAARRYGPLVLAGGLDPENVREALAAVAPWAIDLSSGVESSPGVKCPVKLSQLFQSSREVVA